MAQQDAVLLTNVCMQSGQVGGGGRGRGQGGFGQIGGERGGGTSCLLEMVDRLRNVAHNSGDGPAGLHCVAPPCLAAFQLAQSPTYALQRPPN